MNRPRHESYLLYDLTSILVLSPCQWASGCSGQGRGLSSSASPDGLLQPHLIGRESELRKLRACHVSRVMLWLPIRSFFGPRLDTGGSFRCSISNSGRLVPVQLQQVAITRSIPVGPLSLCPAVVESPGIRAIAKHSKRRPTSNKQAGRLKKPIVLIKHLKYM